MNEKERKDTMAMSRKDFTAHSFDRLNLQVVNDRMYIFTPFSAMEGTIEHVFPG